LVLIRSYEWRKPYFHIEWIMDNVFKLSPEKKQKMKILVERIPILLLRMLVVRQEKVLAVEAADSSGGGGDDFRRGGGDFGGEPGNSMNLGGAKQEHRGAQAPETPEHQY
jgi:hypothetical protein